MGASLGKQVVRLKANRSNNKTLQPIYFTGVRILAVGYRSFSE